MRTGELSGKSDEMQGGGEPCNGLASHRGWGGGGGKYYYSSSLLAMNNVVSQAVWAHGLPSLARAINNEILFIRFISSQFDIPLKRWTLSGRKRNLSLCSMKS